VSEPVCKACGDEQVIVAYEGIGGVVYDRCPHCTEAPKPGWVAPIVVTFLFTVLFIAAKAA
jgi:hypothetical protein